MNNKLLQTAVFAFGLINFTAIAAPNFSAAQIAQFQQLPRAQQQALARQYGVNINDLTAAGSTSTTTSRPPVQTISPRPQNRETDQHLDSQANNQQLINFGYDLFSGQPSSYTPIDDLPVPNNYLIAPNDEIDVQLFGSQNTSYALDVSRDGSIQFPELGPIHVAGQTFKELKANLTNRIKKQILGVDVSISLGSLRMMQVYVTGDVYQPGAYNIPSLATVTQALIAAGGFRQSGSLRDITIRRNNKVIDHLDLYELLLKGKTDHDIRLQSGDTVFVAAKGQSVSIDGQVRRPAVYEIKSGDSLGQLLADAGGSQANAYLQQVQIKRYSASGEQVLTKDLTTSEGKSFHLQDGDKVHLAPVSEQLLHSVIVRGAVTRQGAFAFRNGMKIADLFSNKEDDLLPNTDQNYALVVREIDALHHIKVLQFNLGHAIRQPESADNLILKDSDQVVVFANDLQVQSWQEPETHLATSTIQSTQNVVNGSSANSAALAAAGSEQAANADLQNSRSNQVQIDHDTGVQIVTTPKSRSNLFNNSDNTNQQASSPDSRENLLQPILHRLRQQAVNGQAVQIYEIAGAVKYPGTYPLVEGASIKAAIAAAGGLLESAAKDEAELTRALVMPGQVSLAHQKFDLAKILQNQQQANFALQSKDRIVIQRKTNWTVDNTVEIQGEVRHPGTYTIGKGETIADLVARAGGLTQYAYPQAAIFSRESLRLQEQQRKQMMANNLRQEIASLALRRQTNTATYNSTPQEAMQVADQLANIPAIGRLVIKLPNILRGDEHSDVMLENGDRLYIPPQRNTISVIGQVQLASNFTYDPSKSVEQYIDAAGGAKKQADVDRIYVIQANGAVMLPNRSFWFSRSHRKLQPGDTIIVPIDTDYLDGLSTLATATQIMYQIGVAWKAIN
ncbi:SLBB domain-containing protein [Celerinatantimonas sp. YJH-8]|uniref:SLBB domain-containing protein n=1 Tax=Celerinatantimonas sp. YJH-8 TaxID=3228714 RepID=UPI0038C9D1ED